MPIDFNDTRTQELYKDFNYQITNPILNQAKNETKLLNTDGSNLAQLQKDKVELSASKNDKYSADDGKISPKDKLINFAKGMISPVTNMFKSPKNFLVGMGMTAGISALTVATGGAIAPLLITAGVIGGGIQLATSAYKASSATTDDEARNAWKGLGAGTTAVVGSIAGAKAAAKGANIEGAETMNPLQATMACIKNTPKAISKSFKSFTSGEFLVNLKLKEKTTKTNDEKTNETNKPAKEEVKPDNKQEENISEQPTENNNQTAKQEEIAKNQTAEQSAIQEEHIETAKETSETVSKQEIQQEQPAKVQAQEEPIEAPKQKAEVATEKIETQNIKQEPPIQQEATLAQSKEQIQSLAEYKHGSDQDINQGLRFGKAEQKTIEQIEHIDSIFDDTMPSSEDIVVYRGVQLRQNSPYVEKIKNLEVGDILGEDAYLSTTSNGQVAREFSSSNGCMFRIKVPKGSKTIDVESFAQDSIFKQQAGQIRNESEILLPRGSNLKVSAITTEKGRTIIDCDYVGSTPKEIKPINLTSADDKLNFALEKLYANPDAAPDTFLTSKAGICIRRSKGADVEKISNILFDRAETTKDYTVIAELINPRRDCNNTILKYFDCPEHINEVMPFIEKACETAKKACPDSPGLASGSIISNIRIVVNTLRQEGTPLSEGMLDILCENNIL